MPYFQSMEVKNEKPTPIFKYHYSQNPTAQRAADMKLEILQLTQQAAYWKFQHKQAKEKIEKHEKVIAEQEGIIKKLKKKLFGKKSEKGKKKTEGEKTKGKGKRGQKEGSEGHGRKSTDNLSIKEEEIEIEEKDRICKCCGLPYEDMNASEDSEVLEIEVKGHKRKIKRKKYKKKCKCPNSPTIITAPKPKTEVIPKSKYGTSFWVMVLLNKYFSHIPINRFLNQLKLCNFKISPGTVIGGLKLLMPLLRPIYDAIKEENLRSHHWHADETRWLVFVIIPGKKNQNCWLWVFKTARTVVFIIAETRGAKVPEEHYGEDSSGVISADRYAGYKVLIKTGRFLIAFCWVHVRRDFLDEAVAQKGTEFTDWALAWVEKIGELYHLNEERLKYETGSQEFAECDKKLRPAIQKIKEDYERELKAQEESKGDLLPKACEKILASLKNHWSGLILFVEYPWIPMDNNTAERTIRGPILGRNVYFGSGAFWSAELSSMSWSIFNTLGLWGINQKLWCEDYFKECALLEGKAPPEINKFLPWNMSDEQLTKYGANPDKLPREEAKLCGKLLELKSGLKDKQSDSKKYSSRIKIKNQEELFPHNPKISSIPINFADQIIPKKFIESTFQMGPSP